jgi:hypothetical protein
VICWLRALATMICKNARLSFTISACLSILMPQFEKSQTDFQKIYTGICRVYYNLSV